MYFCLLILIYLGVERALYFNFLVKVGRSFEVYMSDPIGLNEAVGKTTEENPLTNVLKSFFEKIKRDMNEGQLNIVAQAHFFDFKGKLNRHLWLIDTIVTAAPLLGLLGTILGIVDTFSALAASGISDPKGVSSGIGTALYATGLGISIAVLGLFILNHFHSRVDRILEQSKTLLLTASIGKLD